MSELTSPPEQCSFNNQLPTGTFGSCSSSVLKIGKRPGQSGKGFDVESKFLKLFGNRSFEYLHIPELFLQGKDYLLILYSDREFWTRDSILEKSWSESEIQVFNNGMLEFQSLKVPKDWFPLEFSKNRRIAQMFCWKSYRLFATPHGNQTNHFFAEIRQCS